MLSISDPIKGPHQGEYYVKLTQEEYYGNRMEEPGRWFGKGAELLGLSGTVEPAPFCSVLNGCSPDGRHALVQNAHGEDRQKGWDETFSAPKSVSTLWATSPEQIRKQIEAIQQHAVETALAYAQEVAGCTRRQKAGTALEPAQLVIATFQHSSSRALDPQLHTHCIVMNVGLRLDGTTGTIRSRPLFQQKMATGAVYMAELAFGLTHLLGLTLEPERVGFHIRGVPRELCKDQSKRRHMIEAVLDKLGLHDAVTAREVARATRGKKQSLPRRELLSRWQRTAEEFGWTAKNALRLVEGGRTHHNLDKAEREFRARLPQLIATIPEEKRSPARMFAVGTRLAVECGVSSQTLRECLHFKEPGLIHIGWKPLANRTPWAPAHGRPVRIDWAPLSSNDSVGVRAKMKLPRIAVELPRIVVGQPKRYNPRWTEIKWKKDLILGELRIQKRLLAPNATKSSPLYGVGLPALRLTTLKSNWQPLDKEAQQQAVKPTAEKEAPRQGPRRSR